MATFDPIQLTKRFVRTPSVTDTDNRSSLNQYAECLQSLDFDVSVFEYEDRGGVRKSGLEAVRLPPQQNRAAEMTGVGYFCHNDVVSVEGWDCAHGGAFDAALAEGKLWGRGTCDMKGSAAAALSALSRLPQTKQVAPVWFFVTGDEECGMIGADHLANHSQLFGDLCQAEALGIVGEPTELRVVNAHKGGCHATIKATGVAAHSSTADGQNANWKLLPFLNYLRDLESRMRDSEELLDHRFEPPHMSLNIVVENEPSMANITVGEAVCHAFFRPVPAAPWQRIVEEIQSQADEMGLECDLLRPMPPVSTDDSSPAIQSLLQITGQAAPEAVCYATDGCCFQRIKNLAVFGPGSIEQAHRCDEYISTDQLIAGAALYERVFERFAFSNVN
ncbi:MAG: M20/M25/M40 family metallo-hydrolase [Planctomycetota bacterium]